MKQTAKGKVDIPQNEKELVKLVNGRRKPKTDREKRILAEIAQKKKEGAMIYIPHD